jgi:hypothetical protein
MQLKILKALSMAVAVCGASGVFAINFVDSAQNYATWTHGSNGGVGFGPWSLTASTGDLARAGFFLGDSNTNGGGAGPGINSPNRLAFGLYANSGHWAMASRGISAPVFAGRILSIDFDNGWIDSGGRTQFRLLNGATVVTTFEFVGGHATYRVVDGAGTSASPLGFTDGGLRLTYVVTGASTYTLTATRQANNQVWVHNGTLTVPGAVNGFAIRNETAGPDAHRNLFANNIQVVPEPGSVLALAGGLGVLLARRRRKV